MSHAEEQFVAPKDLHLALENCERRYDELLRAVTDYTYTVTVENGVAVKTRHSAACLGVTGFSQEEYEAQPYLWLEMIHLEDRDIVLKQTADILAGQDSSVLEHRIYHKDGSIRWIQNTLFRRYNTNYSLIAYDGLIRDITERKRAEEQVAHAAKEWTNTFDSINDLVSVHDQEFRFIKVNKSLADFLGMNPADLLGKKCFKLIHGQDQPWFDCPHAQVLKTNRTVSAEIADPNLGGTILLITCSPYFERFI
jgi:sigma-B regulation protein RsbU (phosphoserine phosphatase)